MKNLPEGYQTVMPYLIIPNAEGFMKFTAEVFGATEKSKIMREGSIIRHAEISIGDSTIMFADSTIEFPPQPSGLFVYVADADKVYEKALKAGAESLMPPENKEYGRSCGVKDPHGNSWWITTAE